MRKIKQLFVKRNLKAFLIFLCLSIVGLIVFLKGGKADDYTVRQGIVDRDVASLVALVEKNNNKEDFAKYLKSTELFVLAKPNTNENGGIVVTLEEGTTESIWVASIIVSDKTTKNIFVQKFISASNIGLYEDEGNVLLLGNYLEDTNLRAIALLHELAHVYFDIKNPTRTFEQKQKDYYADEAIAYTEEFRVLRGILNNSLDYKEKEELASDSLMKEWGKNNIVFVGYDQNLFTEIAKELYPEYNISKNKDFLPLLFWMNLNFKIIENNTNDFTKQMELKVQFLKQVENLGFILHN